MAKNFKSVGNAGIRFDLKDDKREMILLDGKVGSGKSMLLSIISYNWFGKDYGAETPIDKLINRKNKKKLYTQIDFTKDGSEGVYSIIRTAKPKKLIVRHNDKEIYDESTATVTQEKIEKELLGCSYNIFSQFFINDKFKNFMSLTKGERRKYMEEIISYLVIFTDMNKKINFNKSSINTEVMMIDREIEKLEVKIETMQESSNKNKEDLSEFLNSVKEKISNINEEVSKIDINIIKSEISEYEEKIDEYSDKKRKYNNKLIQTETELNNYEKNKNKENDRIVCPNCSTEISITDYFNKIDVENHKSVIDKCNDRISKITEFVTKIKKDLSEKENIKSDFRVKKNKLSEYLSEEKRYVDKINEGDKDLTETIKQIEEELNEYNENRETQKIEIRYLETIQKILSDDGLRKYIIKSILPYINKKIKYYMEQFNMNYIFRFDDNFEEFMSDGRNDVSWGEFSSGQQTCINLSILFAFYYFISIKSIFRLNLQFFDETLDRSLDSERTEMLFDILRYDKLFDDKNIILTTHKENIKDLGYDRIVRAEITDFTKYIEVGEKNVHNSN